MRKMPVRPLMMGDVIRRAARIGQSYSHPHSVSHGTGSPNRTSATNF